MAKCNQLTSLPFKGLTTGGKKQPQAECCHGSVTNCSGRCQLCPE